MVGKWDGWAVVGSGGENQKQIDRKSEEESGKGCVAGCKRECCDDECVDGRGEGYVMWSVIVWRGFCFSPDGCVVGRTEGCAVGALTGWPLGGRLGCFDGY